MQLSLATVNSVSKSQMVCISCHCCECVAYTETISSSFDDANRLSKLKILRLHKDRYNNNQHIHTYANLLFIIKISVSINVDNISYMHCKEQ